MLRPTRILHPTDFSDFAATAYDHALHLARHYEAPLDLLHVVPTFGEDPIRGAFERSTDEKDFLKRLYQEAEQHLKALAKTNTNPHVSVRRILTSGDAAAPAILDYVAKEGVDLIVMGTHGRRGMRHLLLGSVAEEVVHLAPCPVMTVRKPKEGTGEARPIQRILAPVDLSVYAEATVAAALSMAQSYSAQLHVLHVVRPLPFATSLTASNSVYDFMPDLHDKITVRLKALVQDHEAAGIPTTVQVLEGEPAHTIIDIARQRDVDLVVIASRGLSGLEKMLMGSVAERVVRTAPCPVLVVKERA